MQTAATVRTTTSNMSKVYTRLELHLQVHLAVTQRCSRSWTVIIESQLLWCFSVGCQRDLAEHSSISGKGRPAIRGLGSSGERAVVAYMRKQVYDHPNRPPNLSLRIAEATRLAAWYQPKTIRSTFGNIDSVFMQCKLTVNFD